MSDDELVSLVVCASLTLAAAVWWYAPLLSLSRRPGRHCQGSLLLGVTPPVCLALLFVVLRWGADPVVRDDPGYLALFTCGGGVVLGLATAALTLLGISVRDDAIHRGNAPAAAVVCAALAGATLAYAGANVGSGPTVWTTFGPAVLALATLLFLWFVHAAASGMPEAVAVDRDPAAAARVAGFYVGTGLTLGRAVAGDFVSVDATVHDFVRQGWPAVALLGLAIVADRLSLRRPWAERRVLRRSLAVGAAHILIAVAAVVFVAGPLHLDHRPTPVDHRRPLPVVDE